MDRIKHEGIKFMIKLIFSILPLIVVSIAVVIFINNIKKKNEENKIYEEKNEEKIKENYMTMGMSLGMCFGAAIGLSFTNIFGKEFISYGICIGTGGGMIIGRNIEKKQ